MASFGNGHYKVLRFHAQASTNLEQTIYTCPGNKTATAVLYMFYSDNFGKRFILKNYAWNPQTQTPSGSYTASVFGTGTSPVLQRFTDFNTIDLNNPIDTEGTVNRISMGPGDVLKLEINQVSNNYLNTIYCSIIVVEFGSGE